MLTQSRAPVDPGRERAAEAAAEYLAEIADVSGSRFQFGAAGQNVFEAGVVLPAGGAASAVQGRQHL
ncbi:hypothetical protein Slala05_75870 [Streptomyces lavendulae subsp. lavendulae]|nr:hypothetical protein Slala05_75870 [Streptomyces lavendulae subsp. lavendulae]